MHLHPDNLSVSKLFSKGGMFGQRFSLKRVGGQFCVVWVLPLVSIFRNGLVSSILKRDGSSFSGVLFITDMFCPFWDMGVLVDL